MKLGGWSEQVRKELAGDGDEGRIGLRGFENDKTLRRLGGKPRRDQACAGPCLRKLASIFRVIHKADVGRSGRVERCDVTNAPIGRIALTQFGARQRRDLAGREFAVRYDKVPHVARGVA